MKSVLLDTHAWAWSLVGDSRLSQRALKAIESAETVLVSPISFFEIAQKVRLGKWDEMEPLVADLPGLLAEQGGSIASLDEHICLSAGILSWEHRDPFDRLIVATANRYHLPVISVDVAFDGWVTRIW